MLGSGAFDVDAALIGELVKTVRSLYASGYLPATSSNFSVRSSPDCFFISESGIDKGSFGAEHLLRVTMDGRATPGELRRSSAETLLHAAIYGARPAGAVLHTHSANATVCSRLFAAEGGLVLEGYELLKAFAGCASHDAAVRLPIFENSQDMGQLSACVADWLRSALELGPFVPGFLLAGHGIYTWGKTLSDAKRHLEALENMLECEWKLACVRGVAEPALPNRAGAGNARR
jgi:methylthioribulose-1-phosphate dehydratase